MKQTYEQWITKQEKLCEQATPGPWTIADKDESQDYGHFRVTTDEPEPWEITWGCGGPDALDLDDPNAEEKGNMQFIAASRLSLPTTLKIIREVISCNPGAGIAIAQIAERIINSNPDDGGQR